jgi:hypothetical protein
MSFIARVKAFWGRMYEGARRYSTKRGVLPWPEPNDARFDVSSADRLELVRKSRGFYANDAIMNRLTDLFEQFTVGPLGLQLIPDSSDEDWNQKASERWEGWCRIPDLTSRLPLSTIQSICACVWFVDGEVFILKTYGEEVEQGGRVVKRPRIQLIESHRVGTPGTPPEGATIHDGVEVDKRGRPIAYWVRDTADSEFSFAESTYRRIPAERIIHIFEPSRPNQYRGIPFPSSVFDDLQDLLELVGFAKAKAKENSSITRVLENAAGEISASGQRRERFSMDTQNSAGTDVTVERTKFLQSIFGTRAIATRQGEKLSEFTNNTPTVADQALWSHLTSRVCIGTGIQKILVFPESVQGTIARGEYDLACAFFRSRSAVLASAFTEVYVFVMGEEIKETYELSDPPTDWRNVFVCPPRAVNVDVGYTASAAIADLESGLSTYRELYGRHGKHWRTEIRQRAREEAFLDRVCKDEQTTPERVRQSISEALKLEIQKSNERRAIEDEEIPK